MHVGLFGKSHLREQRAAALQCRGAWLLLHIERPLDDVLERRAMREQVEALEHHRDLRADRDDRRRIAIDARALDAIHFHVTDQLLQFVLAEGAET